MAKSFSVTAIWDADAGVFTTQSDIPGLVVEAATFEEMVDLVRALAPEVIAANVPGAPASKSFEIVLPHDSSGVVKDYAHLDSLVEDWKP